VNNIQAVINEALKPQERKPSGLISPSSLGQCFRRQYWARKGEMPSNPIDDRAIRVFKCGNLFEKFVVDNLLKVNPELKTQVEITKDDIHGYADIVTADEVIDIKSQNSKKFWYVAQEIKAGKKVEDIFYNNWMQVMTYAWVLGKEKAGLVFVSKDDLCIEQYTLPLDEYWKNEIDMELTKIRYYWDSKTLPPVSPRLYWKEKEQKFGECGWCPFKDKCGETK